jgi:hypothetical protein
MHSHGDFKHARKRRKRTRKLSDNHELMTSVIVMVFCGLLLIAVLTYVLSTRSCRLPRYLQ